MFSMFYDFSRLIDLYGAAGAREIFENLCVELYRRKYGDQIHQVKAGKGGDGGIDFFRKNGRKLDVYQCKFFTGNMNSDHWPLVSQSFQRAKENPDFEVGKWILLTACEFTPTYRKKWEIFEGDAKKDRIKVEYQQGSDIIADLQKPEYKDIYERIFKDDLEKKIQEIHQHLYGSSDFEKEFEKTGDPDLQKLTQMISMYLKVNPSENADEGKETAKSPDLKGEPVGKKTEDSKNYLNEIYKLFKEICDEDFNIEFDQKADLDSTANSGLKPVQKEAYFWMGMVKKNIEAGFSGNQKKYPEENPALLQACHCFQLSETARGWFEIYQIIKGSAKRAEKVKDTLKKEREAQTEEQKKEEYAKKIAEAEERAESAWKCAQKALNKSKEKDYPAALYEEAVKDLKDSEPMSASAREYLEKIINYSDSDLQMNIYKANAYYQLYKHSGDEPEKCNEYLQKSLYLGSDLAARDDHAKRTNPLLPQNTRAQSASKGICILNASNERAEWFCRSVPSTWKLYTTSSVSEKEGNLGCEPVSQLVYGMLHYDIPIRYVLISDDLHKNLRDATELLENLRQSHILSNRRNVEIYLRCIISQAAPIIDTILNCMDKKAIPVHLIDEDRASAQILLAEHPLFFPQWKRQEPDSNPFHLTIIGNNDCAMWLLREASWMLDSENESKNKSEKTQKKTGEITVFAPNAESFGKRFGSICPGLYGPGREEIADWLSLPKYHFMNASLSDGTLIDYIQRSNFSTDYIVICQGTDEENLELAIQIRQLMIRKYRFDLAKMPVIAYHCKDNYLAYIGKRTVVENESFGYTWMNSYQLLPFGSYELYSWSNMIESTIETMSKCMHLGYYEVEPSPDDTSKYNEALRSYYERAYNHDSSRSIALSLPYRLWKTIQIKSQDSEQPDSESDIRKILSDWHLEDDHFFFSTEGADRIADFLQEYCKNNDLFTDKEIEEMAVWEHNRWSRWMLSRGYLPMSPLAMRHFISLGNNRQNLSVGKLHALICPYEKIQIVEHQLSTARNQMKPEGYLRDLDTRNIQWSVKFWRREWYSSLQDKND